MLTRALLEQGMQDRPLADHSRTSARAGRVQRDLPGAPVVSELFLLAAHHAEWSSGAGIRVGLDGSRLLFLLCLVIAAAGCITLQTGCALRTRRARDI